MMKNLSNPFRSGLDHGNILALSTIALALLSNIPASAAQECREDVVIKSTLCDPNNKELCEKKCGVLGAFLLGKCCSHVGVSASILAYEVSDLWVDRLNVSIFSLFFLHFVEVLI